MKSVPAVRSIALAIAVFTSSRVACQDAQQGKVLQPIDVMRLCAVTHAWLTPDAQTVLFTQQVPRDPAEGAGGARTHLFVVPIGGGEPRALLDGKADARGIALAPAADGKLVTFLHKPDDGPHTEIFVMAIDGSERVQLTTTPHGVGDYRWRPDGGAIAFTVADPAPAARAAARAAGFEQRVHDEDFDALSLWIWERETGAVRRLTEGVSVFGFEWKPTGDELAVAIAPRNLIDDRYMRQRLHVVDSQSGAMRPLVDNPGKLGGFAWSPDGTTLAYISAADRRDPHAGMLYRIVDGADAPTALSDGFVGAAHELDWHDDGSLLVTLSVGVHTELAKFDTVVAERTTLAREEGVAARTFAHARRADGSDAFVLVASTPAHPAELFTVEAERLQRITNCNPWLGEIALGRQEVVRYAARDGLEIEGLLIHPIGFRKGTRWPLVIIAHGGPEAHYDHGWLTRYSEPGQVLAGRGFFAWYPNYRASTGYGVEFAKADHGDPMGGEFRDHLDAIDHFVARELVDRTRVGIMGGSYGGYTAAWAATKHSEHFAAAVSFVPFVDIRTKWLTSDISNEFYLVHYEEMWPHEQPGFLADRSPLTYADRCRTPLLLLGGDADPRVHPSQPHMLYRAVQMATDTPVRYVKYPGEGHGNRKNTNQFDYMLRSLRWLEHYLVAGDRRDAAPPPIDIDYTAAGWK